MKPKYIITTLLCLFLITPRGYAQDTNKLFDKYADMDNVTSVYISKAMFQMMPVIESIGLNLVNMKGKVESLQVLSTQRSDLAPKMRDEFSTLIKKQHSELMRVRDGKTKATFYADMKGDSVKDLLMIADTEEGFTVIQLLGNFTLQDIQDIARDMQ